MPWHVRFRFVRDYPLERTYGNTRYRFLIRAHGAEMSLVVKKEATPPVTVVLTSTFYGRWWLDNALYRRGFETETGSPQFKLMERLERDGYVVRALGTGRRE